MNVATITISGTQDYLFTISREGDLYQSFVWQLGEKITTIKVEKIKGFGSKVISVSTASGGTTSFLALTEDKNVYYGPTNDFTATKLDIRTKTKAVALGWRSAVILTESGELFEMPRLRQVTTDHFHCGRVVEYMGACVPTKLTKVMLPKDCGDILSLKSSRKIYLAVTSKGKVLKWKDGENPEIVSLSQHIHTRDVTKEKYATCLLGNDDIFVYSSITSHIHRGYIPWDMGRPVSYLHPFIVTDSGKLIEHIPDHFSLLYNHKLNVIELDRFNAIAIFPLWGAYEYKKCAILSDDGRVCIFDREKRPIYPLFITELPQIKAPNIHHHNWLSKLQLARLRSLYGIWYFSITSCSTYHLLPREILQIIFSYL